MLTPKKALTMIILDTVISIPVVFKENSASDVPRTLDATILPVYSVLARKPVTLMVCHRPRAGSGILLFATTQADDSLKGKKNQLKITHASHKAFYSAF